MKVLLITDTHDPHHGGAEKYFFKLKQELQKQPIEIFSLGFGSKNEIGRDFVILKETPSKIFRQCWRMFFNPYQYWQLRKWIKKINPEIIHLHNINKYTPSLFAALKNFPLIQTVHDFSMVCPTQWNLHQNLDVCAQGFNKKCILEHRRTYSYLSYFLLLFSFWRKRLAAKKQIKHFIAPSPLLANYLKLQEFPAVSYLPPFVKKQTKPDFDKINPHQFLYVGQLEKQKGVQQLIDEFALACRKNPGLVLKIAGQGSEKSLLQQKIREMNLEKNIFILNWVKNPEELYRESASVIFPSIGLESFGLVMTEAMGHARPVIGSNRGPTSWLVEDEKTGLLFDPLKKGELAEKILRVAGNTKLIEKLGKNGHDKLQTFLDDEAIVNELLRIYKKLS